LNIKTKNNKSNRYKQYKEIRNAYIFAAQEHLQNMLIAVFQAHSNLSRVDQRRY
jgi:hypothetical protein